LRVLLKRSRDVVLQVVQLVVELAVDLLPLTCRGHRELDRVGRYLDIDERPELAFDLRRTVLAESSLEMTV